ncbi:MAG: phosphatase PAP2 family protein [Bacteroidota bacterium]
MRARFLMMVCALPFSLWAQPTFFGVGAQTSDQDKMYRLNWATDLPITGGGFAYTAAISLWDASLPRPTETEILRLDPTTINRFDRGATTNLSQPINTLSDVGMLVGGMSPALLYLDPAVRADGWDVALMGFEMAMINLAFTQTAKVFTRRYRPYMYNPNYPLEDKLTDPDGAHSFWSGHTSIASSMSFYTAKVFNDYHPDSPWRYAVWGAAAVVPAVTGWGRVGAGKHYYSDVIVGYITGALIGCWAHRLCNSGTQ